MKKEKGKKDRYDTQRPEKIQKRPLTCLKKEEQKKRGGGAGFRFVCTCGSHTQIPGTRLQFQIETRKTDRCIAVLPFVLVTSNTYLMYGTAFWLYLLMGDELGSATDIERLLCVLRTVCTTFHLDRERGFLELSYRF